MQGNVFKVKEGKLEQWKAWCEELNTTRKAEALETLKEEGLIYASFVLFSLNGDHYAIGMGIGEGKESNKNREINQRHMEMKRECLEKVDSFNVLYEIKID